MSLYTGTEPKELELYKRTSKGRKRCITARRIHAVVNNYALGDVELLQEALEQSCNYGIIGKEVGANGTPHLQCYFQWSSPKSLASIQKEIYAALGGRKCWLTVANGSAKQNRTYCSKDGDFIEFGDVPSPGKRTDWDAVKAAIDNGADSEAMLDMAPELYIRHHSGIDRAIALKMRSRAMTFRDVKVTLITGPTGTGKTRWIYDKFEQADWHKICKVTGDELKGKFFLDYRGQETLLIDEYANQVPITKLLTILDGHPLTLNVKNGYTYALWTQVVITTNLRQLHTSAMPEHCDALRRRITETVDLWPAEDAVGRGRKRGREDAASTDAHGYNEPPSRRGYRRGIYRGYGKSKPW